MRLRHVSRSGRFMASMLGIGAELLFACGILAAGIAICALLGAIPGPGR